MAEAKKKSGASNRTILITNGYRSTNKDYAGRKVITLGNKKYKTQAAMQDAWKACSEDISEDDYVMGAGDPGIFSDQFGKQVSQILSLENIWCPTDGLGMVCLAAMYPRFDLSALNLTNKPNKDDDEPTAKLNSRDWWDFVCSLSGQSFTSVVSDAFSHGRRVVIAIPGLQIWDFKNDLERLVEKHVKAKTLENLWRGLRIVGPDLEKSLPPKLLPCAMPYDKDALERLIPGLRSSGPRRMAKLFMELCPGDEKGRSDPMEDSNALLAAYADKKRVPIVYENGGANKSSRDDLSDEEFTTRVKEFLSLVGVDSVRITRMLKDANVRVDQERLTKTLNALSRKK